MARFLFKTSLTLLINENTKAQSNKKQTHYVVVYLADISKQKRFFLSVNERQITTI